MTFLSATEWLNWQDTNATSETRFSEHGVVNIVKNSTAFADYISPSARERLATHSSLRDVKIPVIKDQTVTVVETPGFTFIPDNLTESDEYSFVAYDIFSGFRHYPSLYANNTIDAEFDRNTKMTNVAQAMADKKEEILLTVLEARKSQVWDFTDQANIGSEGGTYTFTGGNILTVDKAAQNETMFSPLSAMSHANKLGGNYSIVTSPAGLLVQKQEALKYGSDNEKNLRALGMIPASSMHTSHNISTAVNFDGFWVRDGAIGMFSNFPADFRANTMVGDAKWSVSPVELPFIGSRANIYTDSFKADATGLVTSGTDTNLIMSAGEEMAIWDRFYVVYRYNSDLAGKAQDIVKIQGLTS